MLYVKYMNIKTLGMGIWGTGVIAEFHAQALSEIPNVKLIITTPEELLKNQAIDIISHHTPQA